MTKLKIAPFGSWISPITAEIVASVGLGTIPHPREIQLSNGNVYWLEPHTEEGGRYVVMRLSPDGSIEEMIPSSSNARTRVHEYGGGSYFLHGDSLFFTEYRDQRLYRLDPGKEPKPISPNPETPTGLRYADGFVMPDGKRIITVVESHQPNGEVDNYLAMLPTDGSAVLTTLNKGHDFYASPRLSPDGKKLAWLSWDHPQMPWNGTELWVANLNHSDPTIEDLRKVSGGPDDSIFQPEWSPEGILYFVSDRSEWWNLYREIGGKIEPVTPMKVELGVPQWLFGYTRYAFFADGKIACAYSTQGLHHLGRIDPDLGKFEEIDTDFTSFYLPSLRIDVQDRIWCVAGSFSQPASITSIDPKTTEVTLHHTLMKHEIDPGYYATPEVIEFPTTEGNVSHVLYFPPTNKDYGPPPDETPPLIVISHGGPTSAARPNLQLEIQYWTSRGFAVADVNYRGSTGYGRTYRDRLYGHWGEFDVADCVYAARYLVEEGKVDGEKLLIRGGSAGGYTTYCALVFYDVFAGGASYYGIADLEMMTLETHKFEARYLDQLVGPYPETIDEYRARSPIHFADQISCPIILFQGLEDAIVPPNQAEVFVEALRKKRLPFAYLTFEGEQHGFRRSETIVRCLEAELYFYSQILGFSLPAPIQEVKIENLG